VSKRWSKAEEIFWAFGNGRSTWNPGGLELTRDNDINYRGNKVGWFTCNYDISDQSFMVLTLGKSLPLQSAKALIAEAAKNECYVIFVHDIDIGFGITTLNENDIPKYLKRAAQFASDDVKTAVGCFTISTTPQRVTYFTCNQILENYSEKFHAEAILTTYLDVIQHSESEATVWYSLLEPCIHCLNRMIEHGGYYIYYYERHKEKWDTPEYMDRKTEVCSRKVISACGRPVAYIHLERRSK